MRDTATTAWVGHEETSRRAGSRSAATSSAPVSRISFMTATPTSSTPFSQSGSLNSPCLTQDWRSSERSTARRWGLCRCRPTGSRPSSAPARRWRYRPFLPPRVLSSWPSRSDLRASAQVNILAGVGSSVATSTRLDAGDEHLWKSGARAARRLQLRWRSRKGDSPGDRRASVAIHRLAVGRQG